MTWQHRVYRVGHLVADLGGVSYCFLAGPPWAIFCWGRWHGSTATWRNSQDPTQVRDQMPLPVCKCTAICISLDTMAFVWVVGLDTWKRRCDGVASNIRSSALLPSPSLPSSETSYMNTMTHASIGPARALGTQHMCCHLVLLGLAQCKPGLTNWLALRKPKQL